MSAPCGPEAKTRGAQCPWPKNHPASPKAATPAAEFSRPYTHVDEPIWDFYCFLGKSHKNHRKYKNLKENVSEL